MIKEPKYLVKFTNAYNDNGTVWYTVKVRLHPHRSSTPRRAKSGPSRKDTAACAPSTKTATRASGKTNCLISPRANSSETPARNSSRRGRRNLRTTIAPSSGQSTSMTCPKCSPSSTPTSQSSQSPRATKGPPNPNTLLKRRRRRRRTSRGSSTRSSSSTKKRWSKATNSITILRMRPGANSTSNSKNSS